MRYLLCAISLAAALAVTGCKPREFLCSANNECTASNGGYGLCVASHCAFRDESCASRWRWDDTGGDVAEECVPPEVLEQPDAGVPQVDADTTQADASVPDASAPDSAPVDAMATD
jgi:hypothetical protein